MITNLNETVELMNSSDYKERFKSEYYQLKIRSKKLFDMIVKYNNGTLDFEPTCPIELLTHQLAHMMQYKEILKRRAKLENIDLNEAANGDKIFICEHCYFRNK